MSLVLDSSLTLAWCFEDERTASAESLLRQVAKAGAVVPSLWRLEVANGLQMAVRRRRITPEYRDASLADFAALPISIDPDTDHHAWAETLHLADRLRLTTYDAAYLELARRRTLPLATLDQLLRVAAMTVGTPLLGSPNRG